MFSFFRASLFALCMMLFASLNVHAELAPIPTLQHRVTDLTQTLSPEQQSALEQKIAAFEREKGSQIAVLIVATTQPEVIEQYSIRVVQAWKLGREKEDDGVLLLVAKDDRKMRIEVGYGLEGAIPDLIAKRVITEIMAPSFKQGDFYGGITKAVDALIGLIAGEQLPVPVKQNNQSGFSDLLPLLLVGGLILGSILRAVFGDFFGGVLNGGIIAVLAWFFGIALLIALLLGIVAFILTLIGPSGLGQLGGGSYGGSGGHSDSWSGGGGGGFGGGGASGDW
ncbi:hypothetical protein C3Y98_07615 [Methylotenera oryzisoli]|uniref:TPM domain-containing protein n=2 Tax=Methylotenera oryzisoli TaxID=2080758 RepID=A0A4Y9VRC1_9PROT|nr:hypothetical protein C3Y98_07615 [Methylotenera oryzisoli]